MRFTIFSKILDRSFEFFMNKNSGYIYLESDEKSGTCGQQICKGGRFSGDTLMADNEEMLRKVCKAWYKSFLKDNRSC